MQKKLITFIEQYQLSGKKLLIAVSGGVDSMVLLHLLIDLKGRFDLQLLAAQIDHMLRPESATEQELVSQFCKKNQIDFEAVTVDVKAYQKNHKLSLEMAAHDCRYNELKRIADEHKIDYILTAHHFDDQLETVFMRLGFGTGIQGIQGLAARNGRFLKPLLNCKRSEIEAYAKTKRVQFSDDPSNQDTEIVRNFWRSEIINRIRERFGKPYFEKLLDSVRHLNWSDRDQRLFNELLNSYQLKNERLTISKADLLRFPDSFLKELIERLLSHFFAVSVQLNKSQFEQMIHILETDNGGKEIQLSGMLYCQSAFDQLIFFCKTAAKDTQEFLVNTSDRIQFDTFCLSIETVDGAEFTGDRSIEFIDAACIHFPLILRKSKTGDSFQPLGMTGTQTINRHLKSKRVDQLSRSDYWVLCDGDTIIWLLGERLDRRYAVSDTTKEILKLQLLNRN